MLLTGNTVEETTVNIWAGSHLLTSAMANINEVEDNGRLDQWWAERLVCFFAKGTSRFTTDRLTSVPVVVLTKAQELENSWTSKYGCRS